MLPAKTKSRSFRRKKVRTINGTKMTYHKRRPKQASCPETGTRLHGIPRAHPTEMKNMSKTQKRPQRPFGGVLSSKAARAKHVEKARQIEL